MKIYKSLLFFCLISIIINAQNKFELSLQKAIQLGLEQNLLIRQSMLGQLEARYNQFSTIAQGLPKVDIQYGYQNFFDQRVYLGPMVFTFNPTSNAQLTVGQLIFNGNYIISLQIQSLLRKMSELNAQKTKQEVYKQIVNTYFLVLITEHSEKIIRQNIENLEQLLMKTRTFVQVGMMDETSIDQIRLQKMTLENALHSNMQQKELALNLLRTILNINPETQVTLTDNLFSLLENLNYEQSLISSKQLSDNLDFQMIDLQTQLARKQMNMKKMSFLPTISGFYTYTEKIKKPELDFSPNNIIGIQASIPIFSSGNRYYTLRAAQMQYEKARLQAEFYSDQLRVQEQQLLTNLKTAIDRYNLQKEAVDLARKNYQKISLKYEQGVTSAIDLITAHSNLLQAESNYIMTILQLIDAKVSYDAFYQNIQQY